METNRDFMKIIFKIRHGLACENMPIGLWDKLLCHLRRGEIRSLETLSILITNKYTYYLKDHYKQRA